ncbi:MAG: hypothetical protein IKW79_05030 [Schwartzia sp.]|nr:hypothetical protein [Schwartzia sp. (in: firmicutes)]
MNLEKMDAEYFTKIVKSVIGALKHIVEFVEKYMLETKFAYEDKYEEE